MPWYAWGMRIEAVGDFLGTASGIKIIRSVLIKGIEALLDEMPADGARLWHVDDTVLDSASKTLSRPWMETVNSLIPTGVIHAQRRTEGGWKWRRRRSRTPGSSRS